MIQNKILVDSNTYFRLARSIRPLLETVFGAKKYCLYIIDGFEGEYYKSARLKSTFYWAKQEEYESNRTKTISRSKKQINGIKSLYDFVWEAAQDFDFDGGDKAKAAGKLHPGPVDCDAIALANVMGIPIVSDDQDLAMLAKEFDVEIWSTLKLLKLMVQENHINNAKVLEIVSYWKEIDDMPWKFNSDKKELFDGIIGDDI